MVLKLGVEKVKDAIGTMTALNEGEIRSQGVPVSRGPQGFLKLRSQAVSLATVIQEGLRDSCVSLSQLKGLPRKMSWFQWQLGGPYRQLGGPYRHLGVPQS